MDNSPIVNVVQSRRECLMLIFLANKKASIPISTHARNKAAHTVYKHLLSSRSFLDPILHFNRYAKVQRDITTVLPLSHSNSLHNDQLLLPYLWAQLLLHTLFHLLFSGFPNAPRPRAGPSNTKNFPKSSHLRGE
jgi:hypothetical protein